MNSIIEIFIIINKILIINQDIINLDKISSIFINIKHDLRRLYIIYKMIKMQLIVIRKMIKIIKNKKNKKIYNL